VRPSAQHVDGLRDRNEQHLQNAPGAGALSRDGTQTPPASGHIRKGENVIETEWQTFRVN